MAAVVVHKDRVSGEWAGDKHPCPFQAGPSIPASCQLGLLAFLLLNQSLFCNFDIKPWVRGPCSSFSPKELQVHLENTWELKELWSQPVHGTAWPIKCYRIAPKKSVRGCSAEPWPQQMSFSTKPWPQQMSFSRPRCVCLVLHLAAGCETTTLWNIVDLPSVGVAFWSDQVMLILLDCMSGWKTKTNRRDQDLSANYFIFLRFHCAHCSSVWAIGTTLCKTGRPWFISSTDEL